MSAAASQVHKARNIRRPGTCVAPRRRTQPTGRRIPRSAAGLAGKWPGRLRGLAACGCSPIWLMGRVDWYASEGDGLTMTAAMQSVEFGLLMPSSITSQGTHLIGQDWGAEQTRGKGVARWCGEWRPVQASYGLALCRASRSCQRC